MSDRFVVVLDANVLYPFRIRDVLLRFAESGLEDLIDTIALPDPDDRHVVAAAIRADAEHIVTENLRDFPPEAMARYGIEAISADDFLTSTFELYPSEAAAALRRTRTAYRKPAMSPERSRPRNALAT